MLKRKTKTKKIIKFVGQLAHSGGYKVTPPLMSLQASVEITSTVRLHQQANK